MKRGNHLDLVPSTFRSCIHSGLFARVSLQLRFLRFSSEYRSYGHRSSVTTQFAHLLAPPLKKEAISCDLIVWLLGEMD